MSLPPGTPKKFVDRPNVSETFFDSIEELVVNNGIVRFTGCVCRLDATTPQKPKANQYPAVRLVMPIDAMVELYNKLGHLMAVLEADGQIKREIAAPSKPKH